MKYLILGDVHGRWQELLEPIEYAYQNFQIAGVIQVGDFGFYTDYLNDLKNVLRSEPLKVPLYFIDGNHEDHIYLNIAGHKQLADNYNIHRMFRGSILTLGGNKIGFMGGAYHVDRPQTIYNYPSNLEIDNFAQLLNGQSNLDLLISHGCPGGIGIRIRGAMHLVESAQKYIADAGFHLYSINDIGEYPLTQLWNKVKNKPKNWVFGHYHVRHWIGIDQTNFVCVGLAADYYEGYLYLYDTDTKTVELKLFPRSV